jgi:cytochrome P450
MIFVTLNITTMRAFKIPCFFAEVTMDIIAAQAFVFFVAGYETSSTTMTFCLYELAVNPDIQDRVRAETDKVLEEHGGNITYESISEMEYLDKVVSGECSKKCLTL